MKTNIHLIKTRATKEQIVEMLSTLESYIKVAVDIDQEILAGGGVMHADCEHILIESGSKQRNIWGADWHPKEKRVAFGSLINIARQVKQGIRLTDPMQIKDIKIREQVEKVIRARLEI